MLLKKITPTPIFQDVGENQSKKSVGCSVSYMLNKDNDYTINSKGIWLIILLAIGMSFIACRNPSKPSLRML